MGENGNYAMFQVRQTYRGAGARTRALPWVEKYRPKTVDDLSQQDEVSRTLNNCIVSGRLPHLLFHGPPGTGKTSAILAIATQLFGSDGVDERVLEMNASQERGIQVVRNRIKQFAQLAVSNTTKTGRPCPPFKLIILDEADSMTQDAQSALRRIMEDYSKVTRFCLLCNYVSRIIDPLASRCAKFRFRPVAPSSMISRLRFICDAESIKCSDEMLSKLASLSNGDFRRSIASLQSAHELHGGTLSDDLDVSEIIGSVDDNVVSDILVALKAKSFEAMQKAVTSALLDGFPGTAIVHKLFDKLLHYSTLTSFDQECTQAGVFPVSQMQMAEIALRLSETDQCLTQGADELLQVLNAGACILNIMRRVK
mmetsp:Transcript_23964/g.67123  ORF Transcript_23964/g.67123 Transcript_23964/m.67123 type:complete len:368 (+) Transcript_23964:176-1279(+)|eukprot:CAMPEP_0119126020 /NCGR_PEP_ID=MMETSP1310-20130426/5096_1 /TAXON_ID=464262 /ORGANISM="Genus nov. species nov., Strain RCC2339" /LENGTH=367 /DNA_ID=CAMNT_0007116143 /DNA_START=132 /DNA_END=1235 /DNA_ORIENTATION=-